MKKLLCLFALAGVLTVGGQAQADPFPPGAGFGPVRTVAGGGGYNLKSDGTTVTIDFQSGITDVFQLNDTFGDDAPTLFTTIKLNPGAGPSYTYQPGTFTETIMGLPGGGTVIFELTGITATLSDSGKALELTGTKTLIANTTEYDFSPFDLGGLFTFTLNDSQGRFANTFENGSTDSPLEIHGSGSFDEIAAVPEPTSMALLGIGTLLAGAYRLRRRQS
jgi:hypothetical protein